MYEIIEHTADLGLRIRAAGLDELFEEAGRAMFSLIAPESAAVRPVEPMHFEIEAERHDELLRAWLAELLYVFHVRRLLPAEFHVRIDGMRLQADVRGEPIDLARHALETEVKAVTWHALKLQRDGDGWLAEVILDV